MVATQPIDYILNDCFLAVGQAVGTQKALDRQAFNWWRARYRAAFSAALDRGNAWQSDRHRVMAVGRFLGERALFYAANRSSIDLDSAKQASFEVEAGCHMNALREEVDGLRAAGHSPLRVP